MDECTTNSNQGGYLAYLFLSQGDFLLIYYDIGIF